MEYQVADAEKLPFDDGVFDAVVSTFGVMFTPDQHTAAAELQRVCRGGGRIGMANWTMDSFIGRLFGVMGRHVSPPPGVSSPANWGEMDWVRARFGATASDTTVRLKHFVFRYPSAQHFVDFFRQWYGPTQKAFDALDGAGQKALEADILALIGELDTATDGTMRVPAEYSEIVITRK